MKYLVIIILLINCTLFPSQQSQASKNREQLGHLFLLSCIILPPAKTEEVTAVDKMDGTIEIQQNTFRSCGFGGKTLESSKVGYLKKCIQGQVYRSAQNDCKGTGSAADYYGAQKFQWCPTSDGACDYKGLGDFYTIDSSLSPAGNSCLNDGLKNIRWSILGKTISKDFLVKHINRTDEIPLNTSNYFWKNDYSLAKIDSAVSINISIPDSPLLQSKNSYNYVLCFGGNI